MSLRRNRAPAVSPAPAPGYSAAAPESGRPAPPAGFLPAPSGFLQAARDPVRTARARRGAKAWEFFAYGEEPSNFPTQRVKNLAIFRHSPPTPAAPVYGPRPPCALGRPAQAASYPRIGVQPVALTS